MSSPAQSPRATDDVEPEVPTPEDNENEQQQTEGEGTMNRDDTGLGFDFEVKEQDRWLPIANGELRHLASPRINLTGYPPAPPLSSHDLCVHLFDTCTPDGCCATRRC
jgi:hypothetical protein